MEKCCFAILERINLKQLRRACNTGQDCSLGTDGHILDPRTKAEIVNCLNSRCFRGFERQDIGRETDDTLGTGQT